jgi:glutaredoxin-dependent peroxiredoxin
MALQPGDRLPDVRLPSHTKALVSLHEVGDRPLVVLFFPLAFSSVCTAEICMIAENFGDYQAMGASVVAISVDSPYTLARFREECRAEFPFLSDFNREATRAFGVLRSDPLGPGLLEVSDRAAFVVDRENRIAYAWRSTNPAMMPPLEELRSEVARLR